MHLHRMRTASCKMLSFSAWLALSIIPRFDYCMHANFVRWCQICNHPSKYWLTYNDNSHCIAYNYDWDSTIGSCAILTKLGSITCPPYESSSISYRIISDLRRLRVNRPRCSNTFLMVERFFLNWKNSVKRLKEFYLLIVIHLTSPRAWNGE